MQISMLDYIDKYPHKAGFKQNSTSAKAAQKIEKSGRASTLRTLALNAIKSSIFGFTADETANALNESILAIRPRLSELKQRGLILDTGIRRKNESGVNAIVWRAS
jgi:hypothetical protein